MFGPLIIDEGPSLSTTAGRAVAQLMLVCFSCKALLTLENTHVMIEAGATPHIRPESGADFVGVVAL